MLVLRPLIFGPLHGYGVVKAIRTTSTEALDIEFGSLYPAVKRLELKGWIVSKWETSEQNGRAKYYSLTEEGRKRLHQEHAECSQFAAAVGRVAGGAAMNIWRRLNYWINPSARRAAGIDPMVAIRHD